LSEESRRPLNRGGIPRISKIRRASVDPSFGFESQREHRTHGLRREMGLPDRTTYGHP